MGSGCISKLHISFVAAVRCSASDIPGRASHFSPDFINFASSKLHALAIPCTYLELPLFCSWYRCSTQSQILKLFFYPASWETQIKMFRNTSSPVFSDTTFLFMIGFRKQLCYTQPATLSPIDKHLILYKVFALKPRLYFFFTGSLSPIARPGRVRQ